MADIFNRTSDVFGGSFSADSARVTFPALAGGGSDVGLLMQNLQLSYQQNVTRLYELSSNAIYYVGGRAQGQASVSRVSGPRKIAAAFYRTYGDVCNAATNMLHFSLSAGCSDTQLSSASYTCYFVVITAIGITVGASDMVVNENLSMMFSSLLYQ